MKYKMSEKATTHIQSHFGSEAAAGSVFDENVFPTVASLMDYILTRRPDQIIHQPNLNQAHVYELKELERSGWTGLGKRTDYSSVLSELRNGWPVDFVYVHSFPSTNLVTIICRETSSGLEVVTAFPGEYAPPFPNSGQTPEEIDINKRFWSDRILLRRNN